MRRARTLLPFAAALLGGVASAQIQFEPLEEYLLPDGAFDVDVVDLDDDGDLDILTTPALDSLFGTTITYDILEGLGGTDFAPAVPGQTLLYDLVGRGEAGDFDGDGKVEWILPRATVFGDALLFQSSNELAFLSHGPIGGTFVNGSSEIRVVDLLGDDAWLDVIMVGSNFPFGGDPGSSFVAILADGNGGWSTVAGGDLPNGGHRIAVGDLDGDGWQDVVVTNTTFASLQVHLATSATSWGTGTVYSNDGTSPGQVELADVDGDGDLDMLAGDADDGLLVRLNAGDGTFGAAAAFGPAELAYSFAVADLDGDGELDVLLAHDINKLSTLQGAGDGTFTVVDTIDVTRCTGMDLEDMDGDGDLDVALALDIGPLFGTDAVGVLVNRSFGPGSPFTDLGFAKPGPSGTPQHFAEGTLVPGTPASFDLVNGSPGDIGWFPIGLSRIDIPFEGGVLVPSPDKVLLRFIDGEGRASVAANWPATIPSGTTLYVQWWFQNGGGASPWSSSNALQVDVP